MPSPVHETFVTTIGQAFNAAFDSLPDHYQTQVMSAGNEYCNQFQGRFRGSERTPDFAIVSKDDTGDAGYRLVLEVGFSEDYGHLKQSAELWLEGTSSVTICLFVDVLEEPIYRNPLKALSDEELLNLQLPESVTIPDFVLSADGFGPVTFHGFKWAGRIKSARLEIWRKDGLGKSYLQQPTIVALPSICN